MPRYCPRKARYVTDALCLLSLFGNFVRCGELVFRVWAMRIGDQDGDFPFGDIRLHHYKTKSYADTLRKLQREGVNAEGIEALNPYCCRSVAPWTRLAENLHICDLPRFSRCCAIPRFVLFCLCFVSLHAGRPLLGRIDGLRSRTTT